MDKLPQFPPVIQDLQTSFGSTYGDDEKKALLEVLANNAPTSGKKVAEFERKFAEFCGTKYAVTVSNGTAALMMAFKAIGIEQGDEVITTPITWIATAAAAEVLGATIKFGDIDPRTFNLDPTSIEALITPKTKAICPVHLYGQPVDMDPILEVAKVHNLYVIEDAAHAPGAKYKGKSTGNIGDMACFSFHEQKNMATLGEGGMITTNNLEIYERARLYKSHCARVIGKSTKYLTLSEEVAQKALAADRFWYQDFDDCGYNYRMNDITAAVGIIQLEKLNAMNDTRRKLAHYLTEKLASVPLLTPLREEEFNHHVFHLYPVILNTSAKISREAMILKLRQDFGIKTGSNYMPLVKTQAFLSRGYSDEDAPIACEQWKQLITLPIHPRLTTGNLDYLIESIKKVLE